MARLWTTGFELADTVSVSGTSPDGNYGGATVETTIVRSGARSAKINGAAGGTGTFILPASVALASNAYFRCYVYVDALPAATTDLMSFLTSAGVLIAQIRLKTDGTLILNGAGVGQIGSPSSAITLGAWNMLELRCKVGTGSVDEAEGRLNSASFASGSSLNLGDNLITRFTYAINNTAGGSCNGYFDDIAVNDDTGVSQNTWPGEGKVVLLVPVSDNAGGTGWTLGTGTALGGNGFAAEDNAPPVGVADLAAGSDPKQIRNATSNANVNYDANLTTYQAAGIQPLDVVNVVVPIIATAAPVTTSAKAGTVGLVSNPTIANVALGAGGTAGAFWSGVAAGTYPTGWKWSFGTTTYAPAVTVSTAPVMRVTQVTASTRIAMVCAMGLYVDFTPHSTPPSTLKGAQIDGHARVPSLYGPPM